MEYKGNELITIEEIKILRAGARTITEQMTVEVIMDYKIVPVIPTKLESGYLISMTFDDLNDRKGEHRS